MRLLNESSFSSRRESEIYNRITSRLLPYLVLLYIISFLDRVNVGFAKLQMAADIGLSDFAYGFGAGIFFIGYCLMGLPSNLLLERLGAKFWMTRLLIVWGVISTCMMFVRSEHAFYALRFGLGAAEAGFYPGIVLYLSYWYPNRLRSQAWAIFSLGVPLSGILGGPLSGWIMRSLNGAGNLRGWQWLFLLEGLPAILLGLINTRFLSDGPADARWLSHEDRVTIESEIANERAEKDARGSSSRFSDALGNPNTWFMSWTDFALLGSTYGLSFWLPQIVKNLGVSDLFRNGLITSIPYGFAAVGMIVISRHSDRSNERRWHTAVCAAATAAGLAIGGLFSSNPVPCLAGLSLATAGALSGLSVMWSVPGAILSGTALAAMIAIMSTVANVGGYVSPVLIGWLTETTHHTEYGLYALAAIALSGAVTMLCLPNLRMHKSVLAPAFATDTAAAPRRQ